jgi:hypothetical protein
MGRANIDGVAKSFICLHSLEDAMEDSDRPPATPEKSRDDLHNVP